MQIKTTPRMESEVMPTSRLTVTGNPLQDYDAKKGLINMDEIDDELQQSFDAIGQQDGQMNYNNQRNKKDLGATREMMF